MPIGRTKWNSQTMFLLFFLHYCILYSRKQCSKAIWIKFTPAYIKQWCYFIVPALCFGLWPCMVNTEEGRKVWKWLKAMNTSHGWNSCMHKHSAMKQRVSQLQSRGFTPKEATKQKQQPTHHTCPRTTGGSFDCRKNFFACSPANSTVRCVVNWDHSCLENMAWQPWRALRMGVY